MSEDKKIQAVKEIARGVTRTVVAKKFGVSTSTLDLWRKKYATNVGQVIQNEHILAHRDALVTGPVTIEKLRTENEALYALLGRMVIGHTVGEMRKAG